MEPTCCQWQWDTDSTDRLWDQHLIRRFGTQYRSHRFAKKTRKEGSVCEPIPDATLRIHRLPSAAPTKKRHSVACAKQISRSRPLSAMPGAQHLSCMGGGWPERFYLHRRTRRLNAVRWDPRLHRSRLSKLHICGLEGLPAASRTGP